MQQLVPNRPELSLRHNRRQRDGGFLLLSILLMMALMVIAATIEAPRLVQQIKRDREEEMIHRGTEYARAIKKFYKKFGRYPSSLDQLDNTNEIRFLRRRYKDPLTPDGKWKLLQYGDIQMLLNVNAPGTPAAALGSQGQGAFGQNPQQVTAGPISTSGAQVIIPGGMPGNGLQQVYQNGVSSGGETGGLATVPPQQVYQNGVGSGGDTGGAATNPQQPDQQQGNNSPFVNVFSTNGNQPGGTGASGSADQSFGGGAIVGVASLSKEPTIRIYNKKKTYNEWQFIYTPQLDQVNVLLRGPYQPTTIGGAQSQIGTPAGQMNQQPGAFGQQPGGFGQQPSQPQNSPQQNSPVQPLPPDQNQP